VQIHTVVMHNFLSSFREAKSFGAPSSVFDTSGCAAREKSLRNTGVDRKTIYNFIRKHLHTHY
jgi:hypothetical protein